MSPTTKEAYHHTFEELIQQAKDRGCKGVSIVYVTTKLSMHQQIDDYISSMTSDSVKHNQMLHAFNFVNSADSSIMKCWKRYLRSLPWETELVVVSKLKIRNGVDYLYW